jgi:hypothetical protein
MYVGVTFSTVRFDVARKHWARQAKAEGAAGTGVGVDGLRPGERGVQPFTGGKMIVVEWETGRFVWDMDLDAATGFVVEGDTIYCNNMRLGHIGVIDAAQKKVVGRIDNPEFNDLHSLERVEDGFLVSSSGIDAIVEVDGFGKTRYSWWGTEHGWERLPDGERRVIERGVDHSQYFYPTLMHTVHPNSALPFGPNAILATLFHPGLLVRIDRATGTSTVLAERLDCPHGVKRLPQGGWVLPDTRAHRVLVLDETFSVVKVLESGFGWVQDATPLPNGHVLVGDANHHRIVEMNVEDGRVVRELEYDANWRVYQASPVDWRL